jgi:DNA-binding HxlR family transcriptional regulator
MGEKKRSYGQHCTVARALDVVGERWTLMLVRQLSTGPKRFKDLLGGATGDRDEPPRREAEGAGG